MASNFKQRSPRPIGSRPLMLKDFLLLDEFGSNSFRRTSEAPAATIRRRRSRSAIAALQKLLTSLKSRSSKKKQSLSPATSETVTVKDILRWRSFRDLIDGLGEEEKAPPLDCFCWSTDQRCRFDASMGPAIGKRNVGGEDPMMAGTGNLLCSSNNIVGPAKSERIFTDDEEQCSPISVLHSPFRDEDNDSVSSLDQTLANVERTTQRLMESIKWLEGLAGVDSMDSDDDDIDSLEESNDIKPKNYRFKDDMPEPRANVVIKREATGEIEKCIREMEKETQWNTRFEEQMNQLGSELGLDVLNSLLDDIVFDLIGRS